MNTKWPTKKFSRGGNGGEVYIAARKIIGNGKIMADGGDGDIGGNGGKVTLLTDDNQFSGQISVKGGKSINLNKTLNATAHATASVEKHVKRGKESWTFLWTIFGLSLAVCLFVISAVNVGAVYKIVAGLLITISLGFFCLWNGWTQNKLIGFKIVLENSWKKL